MLYLLRAKAFAQGVLAAAAFLSSVSCGFGESVSVDLSVPMASSHSHISVRETVVPVPGAVAGIPGLLEGLAANQAQGPISVEAPRRISLEQMRRADVLYPDQGLTERFVELSTNCPPLFGTDD